MPLRATYYDFFGVSRTASPEQIRSAYVLLMKQYHPDLADPADPRRASDFAAILNRCYCVLKDPEKRAHYDALLEQGGKRRELRRRALLTGQTDRSRSRGWDASSKGAAFVACVSVVLVATAIWTPIGLVAPQTDDVAVASSGSSAPVAARGAAFRKQVRRAMTATVADAELSSQRCFASALDGSNITQMDMCVVFDDAYLDWNDATPAMAAHPVYFNNTVVRLRHINAMDAVGSNPRRLDELRKVALNGLLREIRSGVTATPHSSTIKLDQVTNNNLVSGPLSQ
jgi:curved DNA-binding protein CbpA